MNANTTLPLILIGFLKILTNEYEIGLKLMKVTEWIREERYFHTLVYMRHELQPENDVYITDKLFKYLMEENNIALFNLKGNTTFYLWPHWNRKHMAIVHLKGVEQEDKHLLGTLWKTLKRNVLSRLLLLLHESADEKYGGELLKFCTENKALNVMLVRESLRITNEYYTAEIYPKFIMKKATILKNGENIFYPDRVKNMHKHPLRLVVNKISSKFYFLRQENDTILLGGYVGHFFEEFAKHHNATITLPNYEKLESELFVKSLDKLVANGTYDASTELSFNAYLNDIVYTHTYDYMDWCLMVPMENPLPGYKFYIIVYDNISLLLLLLAFILFSIVLALTYLGRDQNIVFGECLFNIYILNGLLGQSYLMDRSLGRVRSSIYMLVCMGGILFNTTYVTYLQAFYTSPPKENIINSIQDIQASGMKIAIYKEEIAVLDAFGVTDEINSSIKIVDSYADYYNLRDNYNTRYVYPVPSAQWSFYQQQQNFFAKVRFRLSNICFIKTFSLELALQENSPFEEAMNIMIGQVNQAGIVAHWKTLAFLEALQLKRITLKDPTKIQAFEPMQLEDMKLVMLGFIIAISLVCVCFSLEMYWPHRGVYARKILKKLRKM